MIYQFVAVVALLAAPPVIEGPTAIEAGTPVILTTAIGENTAYKWQLLSDNAELTVYDICPADKPAHQICILSRTVPGSYRIQLIAAAVDEDTITPIIEIAEHLVTIAPGDGPSTPPVIPPGVGIVEKSIRDLAKNADDPKTALILASLFSILSDQPHHTPADLLRATDAAVTVAIKGKPQWAEFMRGLEIILKAIKADGKLSTIEQHRATWKQISAGLILAAKT